LLAKFLLSIRCRTKMTPATPKNEAALACKEYRVIPEEPIKPFSRKDGWKQGRKVVVRQAGRGRLWVWLYWLQRPDRTIFVSPGKQFQDSKQPLRPGNHKVVQTDHAA
jgi:hypothetical protein